MGWVFFLNYFEYKISSGFIEEEEFVPNEYEDSIEVKTEYSFSDKYNSPVYLEPENETRYPILVWWMPFTGNSRIIQMCSLGSCLFTHSRTEYDNPLTEGFLFYGTRINWEDLPLPRKHTHTWNLLHEESPKNNWVLATEDGIGLFNYTATCSRHSSYPLITQYLESVDKLMTPLKYSTSEKSKNDYGLVMYLHSDCGTPSDRDSYVTELMKYVKVDSYGKCVHNADLPEHLRDPISGMNSPDLMDIISHYKFVLSFENAICEDYITEKLWRTLEAGSVPVYKGSPSVIDWAPNDHSIILVNDFSSPQVLADYLLDLDKNDAEYEKYLEYKIEGIANKQLLEHLENREWAVNDRTGKLNFVDGFQCHICDTIHDRKTKIKEGVEVKPLIANHDHYNCEYPKPLIKRKKQMFWWKDEVVFWRHIATKERYRIKAVSEAIHKGGNQKNVTTAYKNAEKLIDSSEFKLDYNHYI